MEQLEEIDLVVNIKSDGFVSARSLAETTSLIEHAILETEIAELDFLRNEVNEIPAFVFDAVQFRLYQKAGQSFQITETANGSLILGGIAAGLCIWLLNKTVGETVKEAWLESVTHQKLKELLSAHLGPKPKHLGDKIQKRLKENHIEAGIETEDNKVSIYVETKKDDEIEQALNSTQQHL